MTLKREEKKKKKKKSDDDDSDDEETTGDGIARGDDADDDWDAHKRRSESG